MRNSYIYLGWKLPYIDPILFSNNFQTKKSKKINIRNSILPKNFAARSFYVHNGQKYLPVIVKNEMTGHKFGEFAFTKVLGYRKKKVTKKQKKKK